MPKEVTVALNQSVLRYEGAGLGYMGSKSNPVCCNWIPHTPFSTRKVRKVLRVVRGE
jgi:hypothetical protein